MKKYQVIGGQYAFCNYGESDTIRGAQLIARQHEEYWGNHRGFHVPSIYLVDDCMVIEPTSYNHSGIVPKAFAEPVAVCNYYANKWSYR